MRKTHYRLAFAQGGIPKEQTELYMKCLSKETLDFITRHDFDRKLLKPLLRAAQGKENDILTMDYNMAVNRILQDKQKMFALMNEIQEWEGNEY